MPTDNPKISLYVPQQIYDRFKSFQEEKKLSMSQAGIVIIAEYFGIEETIKEITEGTTIGGVTLAEFEQLKQRVAELEILALLDKEKVNQSKSTTEPKKIKNQNINQLLNTNISNLAESKPSQLELIEENNILIDADLLAKRLGIKNPKSINNKRSEVYKNANPNAEAEFCEWSRQKDFDNIAWKPIKKGTKVNYVIQDKLPDELLSRLNKWIVNNTL